MAVYLRDLGPGAAFHTAQEYQALSGKQIGSGRGTPVDPIATEAADNFQAWRKEMRTLFRKVLADNKLDGLFFPQAGAPITKLVEDPARPDYTPNNHPELPSNIINDIGLPTVTLPFSYYADGTPFAVAFIGDLWTDALLLGWAFDLEQATKARVKPALKEKP
jgi:amidase/aspartyl-tRNA(Asn)/glutamyl-tRNA(Gln) amidotransferase subunit A